MIRAATREDLAQITALYNDYVVNTPVTFDIEPFKPEQRLSWFEDHASGGRYQLFVAEESGVVRGYAGSARWRAKAAYETTVETTIYCARGETHKGLGTALYTRLFAALKSQDVHRAVAGATMPNDASVKLHERFGFRKVGTFSEVGRKFGKYWDVLWMEKLL